MVSNESLMVTGIRHLRKCACFIALSESFFALCIVQIAENERAKQQMNLMPGGSSEYELNIQPPSFGSRNFLQVNDLQPNHQFSRHDQTALQQV
ncbi:hypothetical protein C3L33_15638, partial [Rhododendron williamsianum]